MPELPHADQTHSPGFALDLLLPALPETLVLPIPANHIKLSQMTQNNPAWTIENFLEVKNGHLSINGVDATELAQKHETPLFVFSAARIRHNIERLKAAEGAL